MNEFVGRQDNASPSFLGKPQAHIVFFMIKKNVCVETSNFPKFIGWKKHEASIELGHGVWFSVMFNTSVWIFFWEELFKESVSQYLVPYACVVLEGACLLSFPIILLWCDTSHMRVLLKIADKWTDAILTQHHITVDETKVIPFRYICTRHVA